MPNVIDDIDNDLDHIFDPSIDSSLAITATHGTGSFAAIFVDDNADQRVYLVSKSSVVAGFAKGDAIIANGSNYWIEAMRPTGWGVEEILLRDA